MNKYMVKRKCYKDLNKTPFDTGIRNFPNIAKYFMYYAPNISSYQAAKINNADVDDIFKQMVRKAKLEKKYKIVQNIKQNTIDSLGLGEETLDFEDLRFVCNKKPKESELTAVLRHLRNSLAHGLIYVWRKKSGDYILFEDHGPKNGKVTSKMMLSMKVLEDWKAILEGYVL